MKHLITTFAVVAVMCATVAAQCPGSSCDAKAKTRDAKVVKAQDENGGCPSSCSKGEAKVVKAQDEKCCESSCQAKAKLVQLQDEKKSCGSGCETLDAYLAAEKGARNGCEKSAAKMAALEKANPQIVEIAKLYKAACNGCEKSAAKLASIRKAHQAKQAKVAKKSSGCATLDRYLALEAEMHAIETAHPQIIEVAKLYKAACNGCEKSAAKLAKMRAEHEKATKASTGGSCCESQAGGAKLAGKKSDCCEGGAGACCSEKAKLAKKTDCEGACDPASCPKGQCDAKLAGQKKSECSGSCDGGDAKLTNAKKVEKTKKTGSCGSSCGTKVKTRL